MLTTLAMSIALAAPQAAPTADVHIERTARVEAPAAEIASYSPQSGRLVVAAGSKLHVVSIGPGEPEKLREMDVARLANVEGAQATHIAFRPGSRTVTAVTVIPPGEDAGRRGLVLFVDVVRARVLAKAEVGAGPDSAAWTSDGARLVVANEASPAAGEKPLASISVIDVPENPQNLSQSSVRTASFRVPPALGALSIPEGRPGWVRTHPRLRADAVLDLEPEYVAIAPGDEFAYVSLQENNAVAVVDLASANVVGLFGLGVIHQAVDASDADGGVAIGSLVWGAPMPDQLAVFEAAGRRWVITANEGDDRGDAFLAESPFGDRARLTDLAAAGRVAGWVEDLLSRRADLGRLQVMATHGAFTAEGAGRPIDTPLMFGTRSVSIWDATTFERVWDSGSAFERGMAAAAPALFNADDAGDVDGRSDDRGPEPEGIAMVTLGDRTLAVVTLERPGAIAVIDVTQPARSRLVGFHVSAAEGDLRPEGVTVIRDGGDEAVIAVCYEGSGTVGVYTIRANPPVRLGAPPVAQR